MYTYLPTSKLHIIIKDIFPNMNEKLCGNHFEYRNTLGLSSTTIWRSTHRMKSSTITSYFLQAKYCLWWADLLKKMYLQSHLCRIALEYANQKIYIIYMDNTISRLPHRFLIFFFWQYPKSLPLLALDAIYTTQPQPRNIISYGSATMLHIIAEGITNLPNKTWAQWMHNLHNGSACTTLKLSNSTNLRSGSSDLVVILLAVPLSIKF